MAYSTEQEVKILICVIVLYNILYSTTSVYAQDTGLRLNKGRVHLKLKLHVYVIELLNSASTKCYMYVYLLTV